MNGRHGIANEAWSPLAQGAVLTEQPLLEAAHHHGVSPAQVIIRWQLQQGRIVIPKSVKPSRIRENFDVFDFELSADEVSAISSLDRGGRTGLHPADFNG